MSLYDTFEVLKPDGEEWDDGEFLSRRNLYVKEFIRSEVDVDNLIDRLEQLI